MVFTMFTIGGLRGLYLKMRNGADIFYDNLLNVHAFIISSSKVINFQHTVDVAPIFKFSNLQILKSSPYQRHIPFLKIRLPIKTAHLYVVAVHIRREHFPFIGAIPALSFRSAFKDFFTPAVVDRKK